jgi:excisionase family DNA binding protein
MHSPVRLLASRLEAAEALGVSVRTVDVLAERGELRAVWIGSRKLFPWVELQRIAGGSESSSEKPPVSNGRSGERAEAVPA